MVPFNVFEVCYKNIRICTSMAVTITGTLINLYILTTISYFVYLCYETLQHAENYFAASLILLQDNLAKLLLYNFIIAVGTLFYRFSIFIFYEEVKENETLVRL